MDLQPKPECREQSGFSLYTIYSGLQKEGYSMSHIYYSIGHFNLWAKVTLLWSDPR
jgi:hypothetical protein